MGSSARRTRPTHRSTSFFDSGSSAGLIPSSRSIGSPACSAGPGSVIGGTFPWDHWSRTCKSLECIARSGDTTKRCADECQGTRIHVPPPRNRRRPGSTARNPSGPNIARYHHQLSVTRHRCSHARSDRGGDHLLSVDGYHRPARRLMLSLGVRHPRPVDHIYRRTSRPSFRAAAMGPDLRRVVRLEGRDHERRTRAAASSC